MMNHAADTLRTKGRPIKSFPWDIIGLLSSKMQNNMSKGVIAAKE